MAESNKMKDMPVNKLMIQMGVSLIWWAFPITEIISCFVGYIFLHFLSNSSCIYTISASKISKYTGNNLIDI